MIARARVLDLAAAADVVVFYAGVAEVRGMLDAHLRSATVISAATITAITTCAVI